MADPDIQALKMEILDLKTRLHKECEYNRIAIARLDGLRAELEALRSFMRGRQG